MKKPFQQREHCRMFRSARNSHRYVCLIDGRFRVLETFKDDFQSNLSTLFGNLNAAFALSGVLRSATALSMMLALMAPNVALALPTGWETVAGEASVSQSDATTLNVTATSQNTILQWQSFNVAANETVNFTLPGDAASLLNRVLGGPSSILGTINANGQLFLINPAGINIGSTARLNVGSLVASTLNIGNQDFLNGQYTFRRQTGMDPAAVVNDGDISAAQGGHVVLMGGAVRNNGNITAPGGAIHLAAGEQVTMNVDEGIGVKVTVDEELRESVADYADAVANAGTLAADGGLVKMQSKLTGDLYERAVNNTGRVQANSVAFGEDGTIEFLGSGGGALVQNSGQVEAKGGNDNPDGGHVHIEGDMTLVDGSVDVRGAEGGQGGHIEVLGDVVMLSNGADLNADGDAGGGQILVGGDFQGLGDTRRALLTWVDPLARLSADAGQTGNGGKIIAWADGNTYFYGDLSARGGLMSGNGGFAEVSGKQYLDFLGQVDLTAANGSRGTLLLDPTNINIVSGFDPSSLNPTLWLDASDASTITQSGGSVSQWNDKSGNGLNAVQGTSASQPTSGSTTLNGHNVIRFDGSNDFLVIPDSALLDNTSGLTMFMLVRPTLLDGQARAVLSKRINFNNNNSYDLYFQANNNLYVDIDGNNNRFKSVQAYNTGTPYLIRLTYDGGQPSATRVSLYNGGVLDTTAPENSASIPNYASDTFLGTMNSGYGYYFGGDMAEIVMFNSAVSADNAGLMEQYQAMKWGVSLGTSLGDYSKISAEYLQALSQTADISLLATNNITVEDMSSNLLALGGHNFTLNAGNNIVFNDLNDVIRTEGGKITMTAGNGINIGWLDTRGAAGTVTGGTVQLSSGAGGIATKGIQTAGATNITLNAVGGGINAGTLNTGSGQLSLTADNTLTLSGNASAGSVILRSNGLDMESGHINAGSGSISIAAKTAGNSIGLGDGSAGTLNISSNELGRLSAGTITIGDNATSGAIDIGSADFSASDANITLQTTSIITDATPASDTGANLTLADNRNLTLTGGGGTGTGSIGAPGLADLDVQLAGSGVLNVKSANQDVHINLMNGGALGLIDAGSGAVDLGAGGSLTDGNGATNNIIAGANSSITASGAIGTDIDALEVNVSGARLDVIAASAVNGVSVNLNGVITPANKPQLAASYPGKVLFNGATLYTPPPPVPPTTPGAPADSGPELKQIKQAMSPEQELPTPSSSNGAPAGNSLLSQTAPEIVNNHGFVRVSQADSIALGNGQEVTLKLNPAHTNPAIAMDPPRQRAYVANTTKNSLSIVDLSTNTVMETLPVGNTPVAVVASKDGTRIFTANQGDNTVSIINRNADNRTQTVLVGRQPTLLALSADERLLMVGNAGHETISVLDASSGEILETLSLGGKLVDVVAHPEQMITFVASADDTVSVIGGHSLKPVGGIHTGASIASLSLSPDGQLLYVAVRGGMVQVYDTNDLSEIGRISIAP